jgi:hypothetical protein
MKKRWMASLLNGQSRPQIRKKVNLKVFTCETKQTIQGFTWFNVGDKEIVG